MVRQAHHENPEPAEGYILSLPKDDRLTMITWNLAVT